MNTTNAVTNADGPVGIFAPADQIVVAPLLWVAAVVVALAFEAWWLLAQYRKSKFK